MDEETQNLYVLHLARFDDPSIPVTSPDDVYKAIGDTDGVVIYFVNSEIVTSVLSPRRDGSLSETGWQISKPHERKDALQIAHKDAAQYPGSKVIEIERPVVSVRGTQAAVDALMSRIEGYRAWQVFQEEDHLPSPADGVMA